MVRTECCEPAQILAAMRKGTYYLSQGPQILDWGVRDGSLYFCCEPCREIHVTTYPRRGKSFYAEDGEALTEISFPLDGSERYVRVECVDQAGRIAWTNPHFFEAE